MLSPLKIRLTVNETTLEITMRKHDANQTFRAAILFNSCWSTFWLHNFAGGAGDAGTTGVTGSAACAGRVDIADIDGFDFVIP